MYDREIGRLSPAEAEMPRKIFDIHTKIPSLLFTCILSGRLPVDNSRPTLEIITCTSERSLSYLGIENPVCRRVF